MQFPTISDNVRLSRLTPPTGKVHIVLDTDTYNEVDDQFAVVHALLSPDKIAVDALYAAPFFNSRSSGPADGMEKSYQEILTLLERIETFYLTGVHYVVITGKMVMEGHRHTGVRAGKVLWKR